MAPRALAVQLQHPRPIGVEQHPRLPLHPEVLTEVVLEAAASVVVLVAAASAAEVQARDFSYVTLKN